MSFSIFPILLSEYAALSVLFGDETVFGRFSMIVMGIHGVRKLTLLCPCRGIRGRNAAFFARPSTFVCNLANAMQPNMEIHIANVLATDSGNTGES